MYALIFVIVLCLSKCVRMCVFRHLWVYFRTDMSHSVSVGPSVCEEFVCVSLGFSMSVYVCRQSVCVFCRCGSVSPLDGLSYWVCKSAADMRGGHGVAWAVPQRR